MTEKAAGLHSHCVLLTKSYQEVGTKVMLVQ